MFYENAAAVAQAITAVGVEGDEDLAGQVVSTQKSTDDWRRSFTPDRKTEINHVVLIDGANLALQLGFEAFVTLLTRLFHVSQIILGICVGRANLEEVGTKAALNQPGDHACIA